MPMNCLRMMPRQFSPHKYMGVSHVWALWAGKKEKKGGKKRKKFNPYACTWVCCRLVRAKALTRWIKLSIDRMLYLHTPYRM